MLGAVIEAASGMPLADYVNERLLDPLGMDDSYYPGAPDDSQLDRTAGGGAPTLSMR